LHSGTHLQAVGCQPKPRFKTLKRIDPELLEGLTEISTIMIEPASVNPVSLEVVSDAVVIVDGLFTVGKFDAAMFAVKFPTYASIMG
jgi:hypothetical protein